MISGKCKLSKPSVDNIICGKIIEVGVQNSKGKGQNLNQKCKSMTLKEKAVCKEDVIV